MMIRRSAGNEKVTQSHRRRAPRRITCPERVLPALSGPLGSLYFDAREWSEEMEQEARSLQDHVGLLKTVRMSRAKELEYPHTQPSLSPSAAFPRNRRCPCGSGRRYKNCCGRTGQSA